MKRLLSILGAITLIASSTTSVIACKKDKNIDVGDFDYDAIKKDLIAQISEIIIRNLDKDFEKYLFIDNEAANDKFESISIKRLLDVLTENGGVDSLDLSMNSQYFSNISKDLKNIVDLDKMVSEVNKDIVQNINYKPILINGQNPLKSGFSFSSINITKKSNDAVMLIFKFEFPLSLKDANGNPETADFIRHTINMNIFNDVNISDSLNELTEQIRHQFESEEYANSFSFTSNNGSLLNTTNEINNNASIKTSIESALNKAKNQNENFDKFQINSDNYKLVTNEVNSVYGQKSTAQFSTNREWKNMESDFELGGFISAITSKGSEQIQNFARRINTDPESDLTRIFINGNPDAFPKVKDYLLDDPDSSWAVNHYNIAESLSDDNYLFSQLKKMIKNSSFEIDKDNDKKTIAIFGTDLEKISVSYNETESGNEITVEMPNYFIVNRQKTSFQNTKEFNYNFNVVFLEFFREFFGFSNFDVKENPNFTYNLTLPEELKSELEVTRLYSLETIFDAAFEEAVKNASKSNPLVSEFINAYGTYGTVGPGKNNSSLRINSKGYIYTYNMNQGNSVEIKEMAIFWQTSGTDLRSLRSLLSHDRLLPRRIAMQEDMFGEGPTNWKIKDFN